VRQLEILPSSTCQPVRGALGLRTAGESCDRGACGNDFLRIYSHHALKTEAARQWLEAFILRKRSTMPDVIERKDYNEMVGKLLASLPAEQRLAGLPAEEVLACYKPEEVLAGLDPAEVLSFYKLETMLPLLPIELLRMLPEESLRTLPEDVQQAVRRRLAGSR
jgi:hypothetical protein